MDLFHKYLSAFFGPDTVLDAGANTVKETDKILVLWRLYSSGKIYVISAWKKNVAVSVIGGMVLYRVVGQAYLLKWHLSKARSEPYGYTGIESSEHSK